MSLLFRVYGHARDIRCTFLSSRMGLHTKILETFKIARFAEATRVLGNAETMLAKLAAQE